MRLAGAHPSPRVVTTNYDRHLTLAGATLGLELPVYEAPALPVGDDFEGIVHLHGSLNQERRRLVVTDQDFGRAYLRDAWAARFLERMFAAFTVMFIGYSHGDVVMQYLARSLGSSGRRYVFTTDAADPVWRRLGLTPVAYPAVGGSHAALPACLARWAELARMGETEHRRQIIELVASEPPKIPEDVSYLEEVLEHPERVRYFTEWARGASWFAWVIERSAFQGLFDQDRAGTPTVRALMSWVVDHYVVEESFSPLALRAMRDKPWPTHTWQVVVQRLLNHSSAIGTWLAPWLLLALQRAPNPREDMLDLLLGESRWDDNVALAITLFEDRTRPILKSGFDFEDYTRPRFEIDLSGEEYWLTKAWSDVFSPMLANHLARIFATVSAQITRVYRTWRSFTAGSDFDPLSYRRSAIEPHEQDRSRESIDVLIDAARDCVHYALESNVHLADQYIEAWASSTDALLHRLAIHAWRVRKDRSPDERLKWLEERNWLWEIALQHEVFALLGEAIPEASDAVVAAMVETAIAGPPANSDDEISLYRSYNLLAWLASSAPGSAPIAEAFASFQAAHPEYAPRDHPDLNSYLTVGIVEDALPFSADELHVLIAEDPSSAVSRIKEFPAESFHPRGPTRTGALRALQACLAAYPRDGLTVAHVLDEGDEDLRNAIIGGWDTAEVEDPMVSVIFAEIDTWDRDEIRCAATHMLANGGDREHPTPWHQHGEARAIAKNLWPTAPTRDSIKSDGDLLTAAINHPAGYLARFWTKVVQWEWTQAGDAWSGLPSELATELDRIAAAEGRNELLASTYLASQLHFYFAADQPWTADHLLPLFDWNDSEERARGAWQGFLIWGRPDDGLLGAGLLDAYLETCGHSGALDSTHQHELGSHLASIAIQAGIEPADWLPRFVNAAPEPLRVAWAEQIGRILDNMNPEEAETQWTRWIMAYWTSRVRSVPLPLTSTEASAMTNWLIGLPTVRDHAVSLLIQAPAGLPEHGGFLHRIQKLDLAADAASWATAITHLLRGTRGPSWAAVHYLKDIVQQLRAAHPAPDISDLINEAMRLGATDATDW
jgi:hypothetical protein